MTESQARRPGSTAPMEPLGACWVCGSDEVVRWRRGLEAEMLGPEDLLITDDRYGLTLPLVECTKCGFRFARGGALDALETLYAELEDPAYDEGSPARTRQMDWLVQLASNSCSGASTALDVGAATGLLVRAAERAGLRAMGVEPSASLTKVANEHGANVLNGVLPHPDLHDRTFDIVFLIDVLEHVADPVALLRCCRERLAENGRLLVVTPNVRSLAARILGHRWWHYRLAHVGYFDRRTLAEALGHAGLSPVRWRTARWYFPVEYLAVRLERYLPVAGINRIARSLPGVRSLYRATIPLDLKDSFAVLAERARDAGNPP